MRDDKTSSSSLASPPKALLILSEAEALSGSCEGLLCCHSASQSGLRADRIVNHGISRISCDIFAFEMAQGIRTVAFVLLTLWVAACGRAHKVCAVCNRDECTGMAFRMTLENGRAVETCCAHCAMHYLESNKQRAKVLQATDFASGQWIDATKAVFVSGSDVK